MGGSEVSGLSDPSDTVEIFEPPYMFEAGRLKITGMQDNVMKYGDADFCINVNDPSKVSHAVLMGIGSVTHHFDYGQRYVELETTTGCTGYDINVIPPTNPAEVPEGFYMLFVVEDRLGTRVPCVKGKFVKVRRP